MTNFSYPQVHRRMEAGNGTTSQTGKRLSVQYALGKWGYHLTDSGEETLVLS